MTNKAKPTGKKISQEVEPIKIDKWADTLTQRVSIGKNKYIINNLHARANELTPKEMPMEHLNIYDLKVGDSTVKDFTKHMRAVMDTDLDYPIILDDEGYVMDGRHRIVKALFEGATHIKFVRFKKTPEPDYYEGEN